MSAERPACRYCLEPEHTGQDCDRFALKNAIDQLRETLRLRTLELQARQKLDGPNVIMITSLISHRNQKPRIDIQVGDIHTQMSADAAMDVAKNIIECCEGSYADAFLFHFLKERLKQCSDVAIPMIQEFRAYRDQLAQEFKADQQEPR